MPSSVVRYSYGNLPVPVTRESSPWTGRRHTGPDGANNQGNSRNRCLGRCVGALCSAQGDEKQGRRQGQLLGPCRGEREQRRSTGMAAAAATTEEAQEAGPRCGTRHPHESLAQGRLESSRARRSADFIPTLSTSTEPRLRAPLGPLIGGRRSLPANERFLRLFPATDWVFVTGAPPFPAVVL